MTIFRSLVVATIAAILALAPLSGLLAQEAFEIRIREVALDEDGSTRLIVGTSGEASVEGGILDGSAFSVTEQGTQMTDLSVEPLLESQVEPVQVALAIDVSGSMRGQAMTDTRIAAAAFTEQVTDRGMNVGLISFSSTIDVLVPFTNDGARVTAAIEELEAGGSTPLYDAIVTGAEELSRSSGQANLVIFSDGGDTTSVATLDEAVAAAQDAGAAVTTVALETDELDPAALATLASETGGRAVSADDSAGLAGAFEQVAQELASQYVVTYRSSVHEPSELDIAVSISAQGASATDEIVVLNPRTTAAAAAPELPASTGPTPLFPVLGSSVGLITGIVAGFLALALLLTTAVLKVQGSSSAAKLLQRGMSHGRNDAPTQTIQERSGFAGTEIAAKAREIADMLPKPKGFEENLQLNLERAGWRLRASEFLVISTLAGLGSLFVLMVFTGQWLVGVLGLVIGALVPKLLMARRIGKRQADFLEQMPETLQLLSGSLRAGYGILQAIDTVVKEAPEPTASEFARALGEARLGMPLDEALESMADRLGSVDFRWVVLAINIQRQVGGNLADLLETVANTLRERAMVRRQIKALSAEGRLSAIVLVALPVVLSIYMFFVNTEYMMLLVTRVLGWIMIGVVSVLMVVGIFWMKKLINIEV